jgi:hypothetical protein
MQRVKFEKKFCADTTPYIRKVRQSSKLKKVLARKMSPPTPEIPNPPLTRSGVQHIILMHE